jgi:hypothetical protein
MWQLHHIVWLQAVLEMLVITPCRNAGTAEVVSLNHVWPAAAVCIWVE